MFEGIYKPPKSQLLKVATVSSSVSDEDVEESSFKLRLSWRIDPKPYDAGMFFLKHFACSDGKKRNSQHYSYRR
jgi:hypothetical protein